MSSGPFLRHRSLLVVGLGGEGGHVSFGDSLSRRKRKRKKERGVHNMQQEAQTGKGKRVTTYYSSKLQPSQ